MIVRYHLDSDGGFTCGDCISGHTSYAYPTSTNATKARKRPELVAKDMLFREGFGRGSKDPRMIQIYEDYDRRHWAKLDAAARERAA